MRTVFAALEDRKIAIVESPTGTGKSLTLLTATLSWLGAHGKRLDDAAEADLRARFIAEDPDDPPWVIESAVKRHMGELRAAAEAREARLAAVREKERRLRRASAAGAFGRKRARVSAEAAENDTGEDRFLPDDGDDAGPADSNLSAEVLALMATLDGGRKADEPEEEENVPKVYFASRTHSQLRQLTAELLKTTFPAGKEAEDGGCGGADTDGKQMCINDKVRARVRNETQLNEACLDLQKSGGARCEFLPKADDPRLLDVRDSVLATVRDIEDLVLEGRTAGVCPYYATRRAVRQSQLVTLPYNLLLQSSAREALGIDLTDQVVVIDEAHNLIDTLLGIYSTTLPAAHLSNAAAQLTQYLARFRSRLKPRHALWITQTLSVLRGLGKVCDHYAIDAAADKAKAKARVGGAGDAVNLVELVRYLKDSKLSRKVSGYAESLDEAAAKKSTGERKPRSTAARHASIAAFHNVEGFLLSLTDARDDGRVILSLDNGAVLVKYVLLNPAERFADVVKSARAIVLAGGTMEPVSDFYSQLFPSVPRERFATLSCAHVIPKSNLLTQVVTRGPRKLDFEFKFSNRGDEALLAELGAALLSAVGLVPDGVVVFLPSYAFLDKLKAAWGSLLDKLDQKKKLFYEPQSAAEVDATLRDYARAIDAPEPNAAGRPRTGALMFAVVGGKLSEGINFSDRLGRCVVMVGLPFANVGSVELQERMRYVERLPGASKDAANELYTNLCMRAVNQSIGRAIRHANDYAAILLVDRRYATPRIRGRLPKWIGEDVVVADDWSAAAKGLAGFFRDKRARGV
ncbi:hypothetical protein VHUM_00972 [Vanrija humicola]|uniref:ATP-dependent DNA helicase CHL1 n=1 Tax=Vanrija humicola TaxID=5417 RepID=A0A7D8V212_VANHU|nr:hypothetical protein VHUM_00972 [Vanrija humicola]